MCENRDKIARVLGVCWKDVEGYLIATRLFYRDDVMIDLALDDCFDETPESRWCVSARLAPTVVKNQRYLWTKSEFDQFFIKSDGDDAKKFIEESLSLELANRWLEMKSRITLGETSCLKRCLKHYLDKKHKYPKKGKVILKGRYPVCSKGHSSGLFATNDGYECIGCRDGIKDKFKPNKELARKIIIDSIIKAKKLVLSEKYQTDSYYSVEHIKESYSFPAVDYCKHLKMKMRREELERKGAVNAIRSNMACMISKAKKFWGSNYWDQKDLMCEYSPMDLHFDMVKKFSKGMTWSNHGEWHVDHIRPVKSFLDSGISDPLVVNALDNLQPLWAEDNLKKSSKYTEDSRAALL